MAKSFKPIGAVAITVLARLAAKNAVKEELRAQGVRVSLVKSGDIAEQAKALSRRSPRIVRRGLFPCMANGLDRAR